MTFTPEQIVERYVALRNEKAALVAEHKERLTAIETKMKLIENATLMLQQEQGVTSFKTKFGTAFQATAEYVSLTDREELLIAVRAGDVPLDVFTNAVAKKFVLDYTEANGNPPPGVIITRETEVHFRKA